jgi:hypothetical protein
MSTDYLTRKDTEKANGRNTDRWHHPVAIATLVGNFATLGAVIVATVTFCSGTSTNKDSARAQTQAIATGILQDYLKVAIDHPRLAEGSERKPITNAYAWLASHAYFSAEAIYTLTQGQSGWDSTVTSIIRYHHGLVRDTLYACADYSAAFDSLVHKQLPNEYSCLR